MTLSLIQPQWPAPSHIHGLTSTRLGGYSRHHYHDLNLATHVGDDPQAVAQNRAEFSRYLPNQPLWLHQTHSSAIIDVDKGAAGGLDLSQSYDGSISRIPGTVCVVLTADCLPILLTDTEGSFVAAVHAGWRGLANGVIKSCLDHIAVERRANVLAWLGPAISQTHFEVGEELRTLFVGLDDQHRRAFVKHPDKPHHWYCDLYGLARQQLHSLGVEQVFGGDHCTFGQPQLFHSYRRDGDSGRMASCIWID